MNNKLVVWLPFGHMLSFNFKLQTTIYCYNTQRFVYCVVCSKFKWFIVNVFSGSNCYSESLIFQYNRESNNTQKKTNFRLNITSNVYKIVCFSLEFGIAYESIAYSQFFYFAFAHSIPTIHTITLKGKKKHIKNDCILLCMYIEASLPYFHIIVE